MFKCNIFVLYSLILKLSKIFFKREIERSVLLYSTKVQTIILDIIDIL